VVDLAEVGATLLGLLVLWVEEAAFGGFAAEVAS